MTNLEMLHSTIILPVTQIINNKDYQLYSMPIFFGFFFVFFLFWFFLSFLTIFFFFLSFLTFFFLFLFFEVCSIYKNEVPVVY